MEEEIVFFVLGISVIVLGLVFTIVMISVNFHRMNVLREQAFKIEKKNIEMEFLEAQIFTLEEERQRMANSFHDDVNPLLAALKNQIKLCSREFNKGQVDQSKYWQLKNLIDKIIDHQNASIKNLTLQINNLQDFDRALIGYWSILSDFVVDYSSDFDKDLQFDSEKLKHAYSIILELIHNISKHEKIDNLSFLLQADDLEMNLLLKHKGKGLTNEEFNMSVKHKEGRGLSSINSRINRLNAKLDLTSTEDGALIIISIPNRNAKGN